VGVGKANILAPRAQKFSVPIKNNDGMNAARENVNIILTIDADGSSGLKGSVRPLRRVYPLKLRLRQAAWFGCAWRALREAFCAGSLGTSAFRRVIAF
jgi:hypothetical protein